MGSHVIRIIMTQCVRKSICESPLISSTLILIVFTLLMDAVQQLREEKPIKSLSANYIDAPLFDFLVLITSCLLSDPTNTFRQ